MAWTDPRTWVADETVTASQLNTHLRDNFKAIGDAWTAYTPAWTGASSNPVLNNGTMVGRYVNAGKLVHFYITITMGSSTTYGSGMWSLTLPPVTPVANRGWVFSDGLATDASAAPDGVYAIHGVHASGTTINLRRSPSSAGSNLVTVTSTGPFTWATSDKLFIGGTYEAA